MLGTETPFKPFNTIGEASATQLNPGSDKQYHTLYPSIQPMTAGNNQIMSTAENQTQTIETGTPPTQNQ